MSPRSRDINRARRAGAAAHNAAHSRLREPEPSFTSHGMRRAFLAGWHRERRRWRERFARTSVRAITIGIHGARARRLPEAGDEAGTLTMDVQNLTPSPVAVSFSCQGPVAVSPFTASLAAGERRSFSWPCSSRAHLSPRPITVIDGPELARVIVHAVDLNGYRLCMSPVPALALVEARPRRAPERHAPSDLVGLWDLLKGQA